MNMVLIVDDNPADRALFRIFLTRAGFSVSESALGLDAIDRARTKKPDLIVLDVNLSDIDGFDVCRRLKQDPAVSRIPVLMLTASHEHGDVVRGLEAGADDYVGKDEPRPVILARIHRLLEHRRVMEAALLNEQLAQVGRLLAGIVHEIRGPLQVVRGHAEILQVVLKNEPDKLEYVEPILRSSKLIQLRLTHLMAAVRAGSTRVEPCNLGEILREGIDLFNHGLDPRHSRPTVRVEGDVDVSLIIDAGKFLLVLINLLNNAHEAIHYGPERDGVITIRVSDRSDETFVGRAIEVIDNGPGLPPEVLDHLFKPFRSTKEHGSGYGLYLSSEIIAGMGGRIAARNLPEGGACFSILLPNAPASPAKLRA